MQIAAITTKMESIPFHINSKELIKTGFINRTSYSIMGTNPRITPPAITDAICPDTFAPTANINK